jgi:hypothetical protein
MNHLFVGSQWGVSPYRPGHLRPATPVRPSACRLISRARILSNDGLVGAMMLFPGQWTPLLRR